MILRPVLPDEIDAVVTIALAAWKPIYHGYRCTLGPELFAEVFSQWESRKAESIRRACHGEGNYQVFVAEKEDAIVAFICLQTDKNRRRGVIGNNAVAPSHQGQGIAKKMYEQAISWMRSEGIRSVSVTTGADEAHSPARRAYENAGFSQSIPSVTYHRLI